ncbi:MAG TPA: hypothetical protein VIH61_05410, partial [Waddliaceae bacterium]
MLPLHRGGEMQGTALPEQKIAKNSEILDPSISELPKESGITKPGDVSKNTQKLLGSQKLPKVLQAVVKAARNKELPVINIKMA